jgi:DNA-directed RNA polymerase II subunit RPB2
MDNATIWKIINTYFEDNPQALVRHHTESYDDFFRKGIFQIFKEKNPVRISSQYDESTGQFKHECLMYMGGKDGSKIYFGNPTIYDDNNSHYMFPNEARLRNMTYAMTIHYDVEIELIDILEPGELPTLEGGLHKLDKMEESEIDNMDYSPDYHFSNFKEKGAAPILQEGGETSQTISEYLESSASSDISMGGAGAVKGRRKKEIATTPSIAAMLREEAAKSMVSPNTQKRTLTLEKVYLGRFPIMVQSSFCILHGLPREIRYSMGECKNDMGGYFIIQGKEKTVVPQEKFADNMLYVHKLTDTSEYIVSAEIRSVSENVAKPIRTISVKLVSPTSKYTNMQLVVMLPNVRKPIPLFILFRALGITTDKDIIQMCLLDMEKYESLVDDFIPSVHDAGSIMNQTTAIQYIGLLTKGKTPTAALEILTDYFLPHIGEVNYMQKAYYLGYMVFRLLCVNAGLDTSMDRDHFKYKRVELVGSLIYDLFREYYNIQLKRIHFEFEYALYFNRKIYEDNLYGLIEQNYRDVFANRIVEDGFKKAFKGNWGAQTHTKRIGIVQDLNRLSYNSMLSHLRKTNLQIDGTSKLVGPRVLHSSQWGIMDPIDTPDGANIGLHKHLAVFSYITKGTSREPMVIWMREKLAMKLVEELSPKVLADKTKIIVNGLWCGVVDDPIGSVAKMRFYRRNALIPIYTSITFDVKANIIVVYTDGGRICRPVFYRDEQSGNKPSYLVGASKSKSTTGVQNILSKNDAKWEEFITGTNTKKTGLEMDYYKVYELNELYQGVPTEETNPVKMERFIANKAIIDYMDASETENAYIALDSNTFEKVEKYTHCEIHPSMGLSIMSNQIVYPENNPTVRNSFSCGQSKQAASIYHTNYQMRMDKSGLILNYGQIPLVKSRYMDLINREENPYGVNAIVAIMCYTGYNMEDSILINEGAIKRGLFMTTYYNTYESHEEKTKLDDGKTIIKRFVNIESQGNVIGLKPGYEYDSLDSHGLIKEGTPVTEKTVLIGMASNNLNNPDTQMDGSKVPKKGQLGTVDRTFMTDGEEGQRIAKVRVREIRHPTLGDKMASRAGQKGTIGLVIPERDMPFTKDGIRPDLIINPHAIPTRMTIGQLVECLTGKASAHYGAFGDCTALNNEGSKIGVYGELLNQVGYHSSGNEVLYNGMTGEQIEMEIFIGPTYYMRLKHMVKDKINYRALGPRTALTKQPVSGRANDGGLRIGEMERDVLISHGVSNFLKESMMERGDKYFIAVCNQTGMLSIYNPSKNLFMSPMADGPIQFTGSFSGQDMHIENVTVYGRNFSILCIPYSLKLLIQELQVMNIQMRLITEDNLGQLESMSFSKNLEKLTHIPTTNPKEVVEMIQESLKHANIQKKFVSESPRYEPSSPAYSPISPAYDADSSTDSPAYAPISPAYAQNEYNPRTSTDSPLFIMNSPEEPNESPKYEPPSPEIKGGFSTGETVYYINGGRPELWSVKNKGEHFITIENPNPSGNQEEDVKVVLPTEISKESPFQQGGILEPIYDSYPEPTSYINPHTPNIHVAPVIKIFNGGNDESNGGDPADIVVHAPKPSSSTNSLEQMVKESITKVKPTIPKESTSDEESKSLGGSEKKEEPLNFGQFLIKKLS